MIDDTQLFSRRRASACKVVTVRQTAGFWSFILMYREHAAFLFVVEDTRYKYRIARCRVSSPGLYTQNFIHHLMVAHNKMYEKCNNRKELN